MKKLFFSLIVIVSVGTQAQNFSSQNFKPDGYPASAGFPAKTDKTITPSANDTLMQVTSTSGGLTYAFVGSRVKNAAVAQKSVPGIVSRLATKATKVDKNEASTLAGKPSTLVNYINNKGTFITIHITSVDRYVYQAFILKKGSYATDAEAAAYFNTVSFDNNNMSTAQVTAPKIVTTPTVAPTATTNSPNTSTAPANTNTTTSTGTWVVNDRVDVYDPKTSKWFGGVVHKVNANGTYRINYDGYAENYDEDIDAANIKPMTTNTTISTVPYVKVKKGTTITLKGNLNTGVVMEEFEWAESSSMACWPGIRNIEFEGKQVAYWMDLPKKSIVKITVTPKSPKTRINIYGYSGFDLKKTPPEVSRCTSCEASHPAWIGQPNLSEPAVPQWIEFNATTQRNMIYFAVSGAKDVLEGEYEITIELK